MELKYLIKFFQIRLGGVAVAKFNMKFFFIQICIVSDCTNSFNFPYTNWCFTLTCFKEPVEHWNLSALPHFNTICKKNLTDFLKTNEEALHSKKVMSFILDMHKI